ncbi:hypothetical protein L1987_32021 [Smallanthus sonchifolius]|uniref:Uncharacterized protein n=1 Tax=Smallanthus sonchifolius TaxID=185202 RepID=A0ACB9I6I2_9ASTR|nr:hypothetical protein L1987_32021 [Smallanthus sonchifolius]
MDSSKEQEILEAAAFHLILLSNKEYNDSTCHGGFRMKKKLDYGVKVNHHDKDDADSSSESIKSGISMEPAAATRRHRHRLRSIVDIYNATRPL